jgi:hypothetical protein
MNCVKASFVVDSNAGDLEIAYLAVPMKSAILAFLVLTTDANAFL